MRNTIFTALLLVSSIARAQSGVSASYIRMTPTALPAACRQGDLRVDSTDFELQMCNGSNTWAAFPQAGSVVTSVGLTAPSIFSVTGQPITSSGTIALSLVNQNADLFFAGPTTGSSPPTFRLISGNDLPNPGASSLGGVESLAAVTHNFLTSISTSGVPTQAQPAFTDISGSVTLGQLPAIASNTVYGNITGSSATPTAITQTQLTALVNSFTSSLSGTVAASGGGTTNFLRADGSWTTPGGGGTVTSVGISAASFPQITIGSSPVTGSGVITMSLATQAANTIWAGPAAGSSPAVPTFRTLNGSDVPQYHMQVLTSGTTWTAPAGTTTNTVYKVTCTGGGGGGGGSAASYGGSGGGGGGTSIVATSGYTPAVSTVTYAIGGGGSAGNASTAGGPGVNTTFGSICTGGQGFGGGFSNGLPGAGGCGSLGTFNFCGNAGGGGAAQTGSGNMGGYGGGSFFGGGAKSSTSAAPSGVNGLSYGGGGSGGGSTAGGAGAAGVILIEWYQ